MDRFGARTLLLSLTVLTGLVILPIAAASQFTRNYFSQEEVDRATQVARDSIGLDAGLVGIATTGEIDLSDIGFPTTIQGYREADGSSPAWGYLFSTPSGDDEIGVAVIKLAIGDPVTVTERESDFETGTRDLDLSGPYAGSDSLAVALQRNDIYRDHRTEFPQMPADAVVLAWEPNGSDEFLPVEFPKNLPIWSIFFSPDELTDSSMVCFVSTGSGETFCRRFESTSVRGSSGTDEGLRLSGAVPAVAGEGLEVTVPSGADLSTLRLSSLDGRTLLDASSFRLSGTSASGTPLLRSELLDVPAGTYVLSIHSDDGPTSILVPIR